jgi:hypothetical protein
MNEKKKKKIKISNGIDVDALIMPHRPGAIG